jgi:hypothetical protein
LEELGDPLRVGFGQSEEAGRELSGEDLADGDGFAVEVVAVAGGGFEGVAYGVAEVEDGAEAGFGFVLADDGGFDGAAAGDDTGEFAGLELEEAGQGAFELREECGVVDNAVFDDFGEAGAVFAAGEGAEGIQIAQHESGLPEGADEVLSGGEVDAGFASYGAIDLGEEGGGYLDEGDSAEVGGGDESGEVTDDAPAQGHDEGAAFQAMGGEVVVAGADDAEGF